MELLDAIEALVKNPLLDTQVVEDSILNKNVVELYKKSDTHKIRALLAEKNAFSDMSHVVPYADMSHIVPMIK